MVALLGLVGVLDEHSPSYLSLARGGQPVVVLKELPRGDLYFYVPGGAGDGVPVLSSQSNLFPVHLTVYQGANLLTEVLQLLVRNTDRDSLEVDPLAFVTDESSKYLVVFEDVRLCGDHIGQVGTRFHQKFPGIISAGLVVHLNVLSVGDLEEFPHKLADLGVGEVDGLCFGFRDVIQFLQFELNQEVGGRRVGFVYDLVVRSSDGCNARTCVAPCPCRSRTTVGGCRR